MDCLPRDAYTPASTRTRGSGSAVRLVMGSRMMRARGTAILCGCLVWLALAGCALFSIREQHRKLDAVCRVSGSVRAESEEGHTLVVVLLRQQGPSFDAPGAVQLVDHFVLDQPGTWFFLTGAGTYRITAFEDVDGDLTYQPDEPAIPPDVAPSVQCTAGEKRSGIALEIPRAGRFPARGPVDITRVQARSPAEQLMVSLGQLTAVGEVASLDDARFSRDNASKGMWRVFDFLLEAGPGLYFLEPYSPTKTPVLFVHGIDATPIDFTFLIDHLDRSAFQPWVYYYPSGAYLDNVGDHLTQTVQKLQARYDFRELVVVAHSMGGLVARSFILKHAETARDHRIPLFISIASPWNGHTAAAIGATHGPTLVRAWNDLVPGSAFLTRLFYEEGAPPAQRRRLPAGTAYHLIFTFLPGESGDGTISLVSQLRREAQEDAVRLYGFEQSHRGILEDPETARLLNRLLADRRR